MLISLTDKEIKGMQKYKLLFDHHISIVNKVRESTERVYLLTQYKCDTIDFDVGEDTETELRKDRFPQATWIEPFTWGGFRYMNTPLQMEDVE
jgi:hypothetical protein